MDVFFVLEPLKSLFKNESEYVWKKNTADLIGQKLNSNQAMALAIAQAFKGAGKVSPNPLVGCVIVDDQDRLISVGHHPFVGGPHAEVVALQNALGIENLNSYSLATAQDFSKAFSKASILKGAKLYVTLEPCAHEGRTPACAKTLAKTEIAEVIYGLQDPNPLVAGQGAEIIRNSGKQATLFTDLEIVNSKYTGSKHTGSEYTGSDCIESDFSILENSHSKITSADWILALEKTCEHFLWNFRKKQIFTSLKVATSLDGHLAHLNRDSKWITGPSSRMHAHYLRAFHDALLVGVGTILQDNPSLNIRHPQYDHLKKKLIIVDKHAQILKKNWSEMKVFQAHSPENIYFVVSHDLEDFVKNQGFSSIGVPLKNNRFEWKDVLSALWDLGIRSLMVEAGASVLSSWLQAGLWQRLFIYQAPVILGGKSGITWSRDFSVPSMQDQLRLLEPQLKAIEKDNLITGKYG